MSVNKVAKGQCPACTAPIPFARTFVGRGKRFECYACRRELTVEKPSIAKTAFIVGVALIVVKIFGVVGFILAAAAVGIGDWKLARTRLVDPE